MRKVLSFVLVLTLVLGSFSMAFAATPAPAGLSDIDGIANEEAIQVNFDLGIVTGNPDGTFLPTKTVTRAEFAAMITRALSIPDSALAGYTATSFKDTAGYSWAVPYLAFCQSKGIMLGDGAGNVMPGRTINTNEAMTMALRAVGYTANSAELVGVWPANYVTVAQNVSLYDDVASVTNVDKANAAQIIYNALTVQKVAVNSDGATTPLQITDPDNSTLKVAANLLNTGLDCYGRDGIVAYGEDSLISLTQYVGAKATIYRNDGGDGDIVAIKPISTFLTGKFTTNYADFKVGDVKYTMSSAAKAVTVASILNAKATAATNTSTVGALTATDTSVTLAVKVSGKTISDVYTLAKWSVTDAFYAPSDVQDEIKDDQAINGNEFALNDEQDIDLTKFELAGAASLDKIAKDDVVYVYALGDVSGDDIVKVAVGTETVSGRVTAEDDGDYTVNGKIYNISSDAKAGTALTVGTEYDMDLDAYGEVYAAEATSNDANTYAVIADVSASTFNGDQVKLYLASDEKKVFDIDEDEVTLPAAAASGTAIAYGVDKDGVINALTASTSVNAATMTGVKTLVVGATSTQYAIAADCQVFTLAADGTFDTSAVGKVDLNQNLKPANKAFSFILNDDDEVAVMVVNSLYASRNADDVYGVINTVKSAWNATDEVTVKQLAGFADGTAFDKMAANNTAGVGSAGNGLVKITYDSDGLVKTATNTAIAVSASGVFEKLNVAGDSVATTASGLLTWHDAAKTVVVYEKQYSDGSFDKYVVSSLTRIKSGATVNFYDTDDATGAEGAEYIVWEKQ